MKKKNRRKRTTRKSRGQMVCRGIVSGLIVSAVVCGCGLLAAKYVISKDMDANAYDHFGNSRARISQFEQSYNRNQKEWNEYEWVDFSRYGENILAIEAYGYSSEERYYDEDWEAVLYNADTHEIAADSFNGDLIFWRAKGAEGSATVLSCEYDQPQMVKVMEQADKTLDTLNDYYRLQWQSVIEVDFDKVYVNENDHTFIPVKGMITAYDVRRHVERKTECFPFSFEDDPEFASGAPDGYVLEEGEGGWSMNKANGTNEKLHEMALSGHWNYRDEFMLIPERINDGFLKRYYYQYGEFSVNEKNYVVVWGLYLDGWSEYYQRWYFIGCGIATGVIMLISVAAALIRYARMKAAWDIEDYRVNTANALAHDLKTPLTAMMGYAQNLKDCTADEERERYTDSIIENAVYTNELINSYFDLARAEQLVPKTRQGCELVEVAKELFSKYSAAAGDRSITVSFEGECTASCDPESISRAIENLLSNAVKYTPTCGNITVAGNKSSLTISNTVHEQISDVSRLTEPFYKPDSARGGRSGSGLGLAIVKQITDAHGFTLTLECDEERFTATVTL